MHVLVAVSADEKIPCLPLSAILVIHIDEGNESDYCYVDNVCCLTYGHHVDIIHGNDGMNHQMHNDHMDVPAGRLHGSLPDGNDCHIVHRFLMNLFCLLLISLK